VALREEDFVFLRKRAEFCDDRGVVVAYDALEFLGEVLAL